MSNQSDSPFASMGTDTRLINSTRRRPALASVPAAEGPETPPASDENIQVTAREHSSERTDKEPIHLTDIRTNERIVDTQTVAPPAPERRKVRHSFDIYEDQLVSLADIQAHLYRRNGKKPKVGDLVQQALDAYIANANQSQDDGSDG